MQAYAKFRRRILGVVAGKYNACLEKKQLFKLIYRYAKFSLENIHTYLILLLFRPNPSQTTVVE